MSRIWIVILRRTAENKLDGGVGTDKTIMVS